MLRIALAQHDFLVGHITANRDLIMQLIAAARDEHGADLILFPELALTGYPPEDLVLRPGFMRRAEQAFGEIVSSTHGIDVVLGWPRVEGRRRYNSASWIRDGQVLGHYDKHDLPNYAVFDERRYFHPGEGTLVVDVRGVRAGVIVCEDTWTPEAAAQTRAAGAELLLSMNASPFHARKHEDRAQVLTARCRETGLPVVYLNCVGGQDDLVFDGHSLVVDPEQGLSTPGPLCDEALLLVEFDPSRKRLVTVDWPDGETDELAGIWKVLCRGLRDYVRKNGFERVLLGLSGGIDSAVTAALAADALGPEQVLAVMLPSRHTSELSMVLATEQIDLLGVAYQNLSIEPLFQAAQRQLAPAIGEGPHGLVEENLQARARGMLLMALSNKLGHLLLATGNKSELAVGYSTLYGDMCGGYSPLKDCLKGLVYRLAEWRNRQSPAIPRGVIERPPSAELAPGQLDEHSLPPYPVLDSIIELYVEEDRSIGEIVSATGFDEALVRKVAARILRSEFKRRQAAPGPRVTRKAFGRDRRYPISSGWLDSGRGQA